MPELTPEQMLVLQTNVREAIMEARPDMALRLLEEALPTGRAKHNQVVLLKARQSDILLHTINNTLSDERLEVMRNNLTADILLFIDHLTTADFAPQAALRPGLKPGHLLYQVPTMMVLNSTYDCLVRVAAELNQVLEGIASEEDVVVEEIGRSEVMEVEILDPGGKENPVFNIMLLSDAEQVVDEYSYTEWVFSVRPLQEGEHQLILKISVLLTINGKERTKNVILRRPISITAAEMTTTTRAKFVRVINTTAEEEGLNYDQPEVLPRLDAKSSTPIPQPTAESGAPEDFQAPPSTPPPPIHYPDIDIQRKPKRRSFLSLAATVLLLVFAGVWLSRSGGWEKFMPENDPSPGSDSVDTIQSRDSIDRLNLEKRLLPDTLEIDQGTR